MAVYVILQFENDKEAKNFVQEAIEEKNPIAIVSGVFKKAVQFCECTKYTKGRGWRKGTTYGWWVCSDCGKPSQEWSNGFQLYHPLGTNLLPKELIPYKTRDQHVPSPQEWSFLLNSVGKNGN